MASLTVVIFSAASSGISTPNASSKAITSSTVSRLSAPRSSMKDASGVTLASSTPRCSTTIFLTFSAVSLIACQSPACGAAYMGSFPGRLGGASWGPARLRGRGLTTDAGRGLGAECGESKPPRGGAPAPKNSGRRRKAGQAPASATVAAVDLRWRRGGLDGGELLQDAVAV